jgi:hypothetical protein
MQCALHFVAPNPGKVFVPSRVMRHALGGPVGTAHVASVCPSLPTKSFGSYFLNTLVTP